MKKIKNFFANWLAYFALAVILIAAFYLRVYRIDDLLGFYYDQGRDAIVIWKLWHEGRPFLIGPVTGLSGIFLGPFYYVLIAPVYLIGRGDPVTVSVFLSLLSVLALYFIFLMGKEMHTRLAGILAAIIGGFSYYIVYYSRWLSNPNPMFIISVLFLYSLWKILSTEEKRWWVAASLILGVSLHFESASAFFYIFVFIIFSLWKLISRINLKSIFKPNNFIGIVRRNYKIIIYSALVFLLTLIPQILFNLRHDNLLINNFLKLFTGEKVFSKPLTVPVIETRINYFWTAFMGKIFLGWSRHAIVFGSFALASLIYFRNKLKKGILPLFSIFLITPLIGYTLFQGNFGNIYDYYLIGYFLPFILIFSIGLAIFSGTLIGKAAVVLFLIYFFQVNSIPLRGMMKNPMDGPTDIKFSSQKKAVDWIFENAAGRGVYNVEVYVPPVIPYSYDYLFLWQGNLLCGANLCGKVDYQTKVLYTLYEKDPPNPHRLEAWLENQKNAGEVEEEVNFGGITVQRRIRN